MGERTTSLASFVLRLEGECTPGSQVRAISPQKPHSKDAHDGQAGKQTHSATDAEVDEHGPGEQNAASGERRTGDVVSGEQRSCVLRVRQRDVDKDALEDDEVGRDEDGDADEGYNPVDGGAGSPA